MFYCWTTPDTRPSLGFLSSTNLGDLLDYAGGLTRYANLEASFLERDGKIISLDFNKLAAEEVFEDGDKVYIASNKGIVSTTGAVKNESNFIWKNMCFKDICLT